MPQSSPSTCASTGGISAAASTNLIGNLTLEQTEQKKKKSQSLNGTKKVSAFWHFCATFPTDNKMCSQKDPCKGVRHPLPAWTGGSNPACSAGSRSFQLCSFWRCKGGTRLGIAGGRCPPCAHPPLRNACPTLPCSGWQVTECR